MTDKELLELAAKAAGMTLTWEGDNPPYPRSRSIEQPNLNPPWNPRVNDGDAFRLAVKLRMDVMLDCSESIRVQANDCAVDVTEPLCGDNCAATRRAIFHAAAEIGRAMP